ncbi:MAG: D-alanine--D-alanine ligase, partial [Halanaerobium sp.]|nr:D-alanine--D-alanine ligase [Halanaerobium sp.]
PYVGQGVVGSAVGMDKVIMKKVFASHSLPILPYLWFYRKEWQEDRQKVLKQIREKLSLPVFVKPANLGSSIGISRASTDEELTAAVELAANYDGKVVIEQAVEKPREINCSVLGYQDQVEVSVCEEPLAWQEFLSYQDKYMSKGPGDKGMAGSKRRIPADISPELKDEIEKMSVTAFKSLDASGVARIDFLLDADENPYVNEINTLPGSFAFYLWEPAGKTFSMLIDQLIQIACKVHQMKGENLYTYDVDLLAQIPASGAKAPGGSKQPQ